VPQPAPTPAAPLQQLAVNLLALRAKANWSTRVLAEHAGIDRRTVQRLEHQELATVSLDTVDKLANGLGVRTGSLFASRTMARRPVEPPIREVLSTNLVFARHRLNWTQERLGEASEVSMYVIAHIERQSRNPTLDTLERLATAVEMPLDRLLSEPRTSVSREGA
jgi:transcriptional regulator with XRE-family HTH domain